MRGMETEDREQIADTFGVAEAMAAEIMFVNDDWWPTCSDRERWEKVRAWVVAHLDYRREQ